MDNPAFSLTVFRPAEAEAITGLTRVMQRDWRERNFLPKNEGHARFDAFGLAEMLLMKLFSDRGIGPQQSKDVAEFARSSVVWHALETSSAFGGDGVSEQSADSLRRRLWREIGLPRLTGARFLILFADGSEWLDNSLEHAFIKNDTEEKLTGPILVLDLEMLGDQLIRRASRPLVFVNLHSQS